MYRIAIGEISHETNTFCPPTTVEMFREREWDHGEALRRRHEGVRDYLGGMIDAAGGLDVELIPTFGASTEPWGTITRQAYETMVAELTGAIRSAQPLDAICLALHGAGVAEGVDDLEGGVLAAVREVVGKEVPIAVTLDLHGNITPRMVELATGLFGVHEYPHVDAFERGQEVMHFLVGVLDRKVRPVMALEVLPLLIPASPSRLEPVRSINALCHELEEERGMVDCVFFHGFPYTDIPKAGTTVVAIANGDGAQASRAAKAVARRAWANREAFQVAYPNPNAAVAEAAKASAAGGPVVINEMSDNPGGGAPGDGTHLLRAMLAAGITESAFGTIYDPEVAEQAHRAGVGSTLRVRLGGKQDLMYGEPLDLEVYVKNLADGRFRLTTPMGQGREMDLGKTARLVASGLDIVVASVRTQVLDPGPFLLHGIDVSRTRIIGLKSSAHFRAAFEPIAHQIITADPPGITTANLRQIPYRRLQRPIYPLDPETIYDPGL